MVWSGGSAPRRTGAGATVQFLIQGGGRHSAGASPSSSMVTASIESSLGKIFTLPTGVNFPASSACIPRTFPAHASVALPGALEPAFGMAVPPGAGVTAPGRFDAPGAPGAPGAPVVIASAAPAPGVAVLSSAPGSGGTGFPASSAAFRAAFTCSSKLINSGGGCSPQTETCRKPLPILASLVRRIHWSWLTASQPNASGASMSHVSLKGGSPRR
mmetsp:Transcript_66412/g.135248  ORF Transcript_66412/g.135248 Transcript_66412/m.135248 type:complete len:215 (+) Transcript_66412:185-829(+)